MDREALEKAIAEDLWAHGHDTPTNDPAQEAAGFLDALDRLGLRIVTPEDQAVDCSKRCLEPYKGWVFRNVEMPPYDDEARVEGSGS